MRELIPRGKGDTDRVEAAVAAGYPTVAPILPDLLEWLQDCNWPVAHVLRDFLASIGTPLIPHIKSIFETSDEIWKYWIMVAILQENRDLAEAFRPMLERIAYQPTPEELREELAEEAQNTLEEYGWQRVNL